MMGRFSCSAMDESYRFLSRLNVCVSNCCLLVMVGITRGSFLVGFPFQFPSGTVVSGQWSVNTNTFKGFLAFTDH